ncbi:hypothetical protein KUCAC02_035905, partial [Chaenocephalus aceratus]
MCINPTAELELKSPKLDLNLEVQNIDIQITRPQYLSVVQALESVDCSVRSAPYRRFRPEGPVHTNAKLWWDYGYKSVLQDHRRRVRTSSWSSIKKHRDNLKAYKLAYKNKILNQKLGAEAERTLQIWRRIWTSSHNADPRQQAHMELLPDSSLLLPDSSQLLPDSSQLLPDSSQLLPDSSLLLPDSSQLLPDSSQL